jgi:hypothetical protein
VDDPIHKLNILVVVALVVEPCHLLNRLTNPLRTHIIIEEVLSQTQRYILRNIALHYMISTYLYPHQGVLAGAVPLLPTMALLDHLPQHPLHKQSHTMIHTTIIMVIVNRTLPFPHHLPAMNLFKDVIP